jgi:hypothetical protein
MALKKKLNILQDKIVLLKTKKAKSNQFLKQLHNDHDGLYRFSNCVENVVLDINKWKTNFDTILTKDEQEFFEDILNHESGWLSPYNQRSDFWTKFSISLNKEDLALNLNNPLEFIQYRVLLSQPFIAKNEEDNHPERRYYFVEEGQEALKAANITDMKSKAFKLLDEIKDNKVEMINVLRSLGKMVASTINAQTLYGMLGAIVDTIDKNNKPNIFNFIESMTDPFRNEKLFIINAMVIGDLTQRGNNYMRSDTKEVIATNEQEMYKYIENKLNQEWYQMVNIHIKQNN